jgi:hypothetical protein
MMDPLSYSLFPTAEPQYQPMAEPAQTIGALPMRYRLAMHEGGAGMYARPAQPSLVQQLAIWGATLAGYKNAHALSQLQPGVSAYDEWYRQKVTTPLFQQNQTRLNFELGQQFAQAMGQIGENLGLRGNQSKDDYYKPLLAIGGSPVGQIGAQLLQQTPFMQMIMGGDINKMWMSMFANRTHLAMRQGEIPNAENMPQQLANAQYVSLLSRDLTKRLYTDSTGRPSLVPNMELTGGRNVEQLGEVANMMSVIDPKSRGMTKEVRAILEGAAKQKRELNPDELKRVGEDVSKYSDKLIETVKALASVGDAIGESDLIAVADKMNAVMGGNAFQPGYQQRLKDFGVELTAAEKIYGISAVQQLGMQKQIGDTFAAASAAVNPITQRVDSQTIQDMSRMFTRYAMVMSTDSAMSPEDATRFIEDKVGKAASSTAGRMGWLMEAKFRNNEISRETYDAFNKASQEGDIRKVQGVIAEANRQTGRNLMADIEDPTQIALAVRQIDSLAPAQRAAATQAVFNRLTAGVDQEHRVRMVEHSLERSRQMVREVMSSATGNTSPMKPEEIQATETEGYKAYLNKRLTTATGDERDRLQQQLDLITSAEKGKDGQSEVRRIMQTPLFDRERAGMQQQAAQQLAARNEQIALQAVTQAGASKEWLDTARQLVPNSNKDLQKEIDDARTLLRTDPAAGAQKLQGIYDKLSPEAQRAMGDPSKMLKAAGELGTPEGMRRVDDEVARRRDAATKAGKDPDEIRWAEVAAEMHKGSGATIINRVATLRGAQQEREMAVYGQQLADPEVRKKIEALMEKNPEMTIDTAISQMLGGKEPMSRMQQEAAVMAAAKMGYVTEQFANAPLDARMRRFLTPMNEAMTSVAEKARSTQHMRMNFAQRITKFITQDPKAKDKMSLLDVLGVAVEGRENVNEIAAEMAGVDWGKGIKPTLDQLRGDDKAYQKIRDQVKDPLKQSQLDEYRKRVKRADTYTTLHQLDFQSLVSKSDEEIKKITAGLGKSEAEGVMEVVKEAKNAGVDEKTGKLKGMEWLEQMKGPATKENITKAKQSQKLNEAIKETRTTGSTDALDRLATEIATEQATDKETGKVDKKRLKVFEEAARERLRDAAESGKKYDSESITVLKKQIEDEGVGDTIRKKEGKDAAKGGQRGDKVSLVLESAHITLDVGGRQEVGTIAGNGYIRGW